jgi:hypothetical protein
MPSKRELGIRAKWMQHEFEVTCTPDELAALSERLKALLVVCVKRIASYSAWPWHA